MATFTPDDKYYLVNVTSGGRIPGEFSAKAAKARAMALHIETGDAIDAFVVGGSPDSVAGALEGQWLLYQPHDDEGNSLPFQPWPGDETEDN